MHSLNEIRKMNREPNIEDRIEDHGLTLDEMLSIAERVPRSSWRENHYDEGVFYEGRLDKNITVQFGYGLTYISVLSQGLTIGEIYSREINDGYQYQDRLDEVFYCARKNAELNAEKEAEKIKKKQIRLIENAKALANQRRK